MEWWKEVQHYIFQVTLRAVASWRPHGNLFGEESKHFEVSDLPIGEAGLLPTECEWTGTTVLWCGNDRWLSCPMLSAAMLRHTWSSTLNWRPFRSSWSLSNVQNFTSNNQIFAVLGTALWTVLPRGSGSYRAGCWNLTGNVHFKRTPSSHSTYPSFFLQGVPGGQSRATPLQERLRSCREWLSE